MPILTHRTRRSDGGRVRSIFSHVTVRILVLLVTFCVMTGIDTIAAESKQKFTREYDLKAAFLFHFAQFVEWPAEAFPEADTPIAIGVLGDDPFGTSLDEIVANEVVRNRKIVVHRYRDVREIKDCHILYISHSENSRLDGILGAIRGRSILSVGETDHFTAKDGMIRFVLTQNKLRLKINAEAAHVAGLTISSKLLRQAEIVGNKGESR